MPDQIYKTIVNIKNFAKENIDIDKVKEQAAKTGEALSAKAVEMKEKIADTKEELAEKITELDRILDEAITEYNDAFTLMNDKGIRLFVERNRSVDTIEFVENLVNSIANKPKAFESEFEEIKINRNQFVDSCEFADRELEAARDAAVGAGAGLAAGTSVAFMAPTAAMWVATTFGTASTGAAISTLSGAAATNAALAWLGGGTLAAGGGGIVGGNALLALAGPVGWSIAGASLLSSIVIFTSKKIKLQKEKNSEIEAVKENTENIKEMDSKILSILNQTMIIRESLNKSYYECISLHNGDYMRFTETDKMKLGALVNNTKALSAMFTKVVEE